MNAKLCKELRRFARANRGDEAPETQYNTSKDGSRKVDLLCVRGSYLRMKGGPPCLTS